MEAGLFYAPGGPWLIGGAFLVFVFVSFRSALSGAILFSGYLLAAPYLTYRSEFQAVGVAAGIAVLGLVALVRRPPGRIRLSDSIDRAMALVAALMLLATILGVLAGNSRRYIASDVYHYLLVGPALYAVFRQLLTRHEVRRFLTAYLGLAAIAAAIALFTVWRASIQPDLAWLVGSPFYEGGIQLQPDFAYPLLPMLVVAARGLWRGGRGPAAAMVVLSATMVLTYKRTFWIALMIGLLALLVGRMTLGKNAGPGLARGRTRVLRNAVILLVAGALGFGLTQIVGLNTGSAVRRAAGLANPIEVDTFQSRWDEWKSAAHHAVSRPLGHGLGTFVPIPHDDPEGRPTHYIHNMYLQWTIQGGFQSTVAVIVLLVVFGIRCWRRRGDPDVAGLGASVLALATAGMALLSFYSPMAGIFLALGATLSE